MMHPWGVLINVFVVISVCTSAHLPSTFEKCDKTKSDFEECLGKAAENALGQLTKPMKEVGLPSIDPLEVPSMSISPGSGPTNFQQDFTNMKLHGFSKGKFSKISVDFDKKVMKFDCAFDEIKMNAHYKFEGKVLVLPLYGEGPGLVTLDGLVFSFTYNFEEYEKNGEKHFKIVDSYLKMKPSKIHFKLDNLFNGDKNLGDNINKVMNDNWQALFEDVQGSYEHAFNAIFRSIFDRFLERVPISEIF